MVVDVDCASKKNVEIDVKMTNIITKAGRSAKNFCTGVYSTAKINSGGILRPKYMWLEVTDRCNSRCEYCNIYEKTPTSNPLSPDEIRRILSSSLFRDVCYIINSGGEPTVRSDVLEVFLAEHEALSQATLQFSTNALLPERVLSTVSELKSRNIKVEVGISLDGVGDAHDAIRGVKGNFQKVDYLTKKLIQMQIPVSLGATLTVKNLKNNIKAKEYAKTINTLFMFHWFNTSGFYGNEQSASIKDNSKTDEMIKAVKTTMPPGPYRDMWIKEFKGIQPKFRCFAVNTFAVLKCNGDIAPCLSLWNKTIGNARNDDPEAIWRSKKAQEIRKEIRHCNGCLNSWGVGWSLSSSYYQNFFHKIKINIRKLK
jgi:MoaA/NifB/PqqE/SkfB family radical SAM enzyme